jgi:hypothetical protein
MVYLFKPAGKISQNVSSVIDLLFQIFYILAVLAAISLFVCTIPIWLIVLVGVLFMR